MCVFCSIPQIMHCWKRVVRYLLLVYAMAVVPFEPICAGSFLSGICQSVVPRSQNFHLTNYTRSPYYLIQSSNRYEENHPIVVELGGASFRGFLLAAVDPLSGARIGSWMKAPGTYVLPCSAVIHSDQRVKKHALFVWQPQALTKGYVAFEATILDQWNRFRVGQVSILPHQLYTHYQVNSVYESTHLPNEDRSSMPMSVSVDHTLHDLLTHSPSAAVPCHHRQSSLSISTSPEGDK